ncbi:MAG: YceD family protein [Acidobacteriota bacterium]
MDLTRADTEPLTFEERLDIPAERGGEDVVSIEPVAIAGSVERTGRGYEAQGEVRGRLSLRCSRCLGELPFEFGERFAVELIPAGLAPKEEETRLERGDLNVHFFAEPTLDLAELAAEQLVLALPMKPLCSESCRGLCPRCGADLNKGPCTCPSRVEERWAPLLEWRSREH